MVETTCRAVLHTRERGACDIIDEQRRLEARSNSTNIWNKDGRGAGGIAETVVEPDTTGIRIVTVTVASKRVAKSNIYRRFEAFSSWRPEACVRPVVDGATSAADATDAPVAINNHHIGECSWASDRHADVCEFGVCRGEPRQELRLACDIAIVDRERDSRRIGDEA